MEFSRSTPPVPEKDSARITTLSSIFDVSPWVLRLIPVRLDLVCKGYHWQLMESYPCGPC